jgi:hypothetical protein
MKKVCIRFWCGNRRERDHWRDPGLEGRIILGWIFRKWDVGVWTGFGLLRIETVAGHFEYGNQPSGSIKYGKFLD